MRISDWSSDVCSSDLKVTHRAAITTPAEVGALLRAIESYEGHPSTLIALRLLPHVFVRPGELRHAEWKEFDLDKAVWTIPERKMKIRRDPKIPLYRQIGTALCRGNVCQEG